VREVGFVILRIQLYRLLYVFKRLLVFIGGSVSSAAETIGLGVFRIDGECAVERLEGVVALAKKYQRLAEAELRQEAWRM